MKSISTRWSALLISIFITGIILMIALYLLDKIMPAARNIKGIENSNIAYYNATTAIESAMLSMSGGNPGLEDRSILLDNGNRFSYDISASGGTIPKPGTGNSEYDPTKQWNKLSPGKPVQLVLGNNIDWTLAKFYFRIPDFDRNKDYTDNILSSAAAGGMINWILSASGKTLFAADESNMINGSEISGTALSLSARTGLNLYGTGGTLAEFYGSTGVFPGVDGLGTSGLDCAWYQCSLKLSIVNPLILSDGDIAPYIEYRITDLSVSIPYQFAVIDSVWQSHGFKRNLRKRISQLTTNEVVDFTVFQ